METLCSLFDAVASFSDLLDRGETKVQELVALKRTVCIISASVREFAGDLPQEERESVFVSNQVFPQLLAQLQRCEDVILRRNRAAMLAKEGLALEDTPLPPFPSSPALGDGQQGQGGPGAAGGPSPSRANSVVAAMKRGYRHSSRTFHEGLEMVSGRLGSVSQTFLKLPEDELKIIRECSAELQDLVPLLNLVISTHTFRGQRQLCGESQQKRARTNEPLPGDAAGGHGIEDADPSLRFQLVSDSPLAHGITLPAFTASEMRSTQDRPSSMSSLETSDEIVGTRHIFGRQELRDRVPRAFTLPANDGAAALPLCRFVSRDCLLFEVMPQAATAQVDSLDMATLAFGANQNIEDSETQTLQMGTAASEQGLPAAPVLAKVSSQVANGLHLRRARATRWSWVAKGVETELHCHDRIALLLESPPLSVNPGPMRDLEAEEAVCLLGLELRL